MGEMEMVRDYDDFTARRQHDIAGTSAPCFCTGPQNGEPHCPCVMRQRQANPPGLGTVQAAPREGWICPRCKTVNAPNVATCMGRYCNLDIKVTA